jgi:hypothetical protein
MANNAKELMHYRLSLDQRQTALLPTEFAVNSKS